LAQHHRHTFDWICETWGLIASHSGKNTHEWLPKKSLDASWRTMTCCMTPSGHNAHATIYSRAAETIYEIFLREQRAINASEWDAIQTTKAVKNAKEKLEAIRERSMSSILSRNAALRDLLLLELSIRKWLNHRRFGITNTNFLAAVPESAREGDVICVFNGGRVPYVLRRTGEGHNYNLVGECYVDGMMRGEAHASFPAESCERRFAIV